MLKSKLRKKLLYLRRKKNNQNIKFSYSKIFREINKYNLKNKLIGGYYPINFEINVLDFLHSLEKRGKKICLPSIKENNEMDFYLWSFNESLHLSKYGIPEPKKVTKVVPDIILVPIVAFDKKLYRIGYGGGYYDRYFEKFSNKKDFLKIGIAYSFQKINKVPINKFDKKLDIIITEKNILK